MTLRRSRKRPGETQTRRGPDRIELDMRIGLTQVRADAVP
jgi:hypothetical protein